MYVYFLESQSVLYIWVLGIFMMASDYKTGVFNL